MVLMWALLHSLNDFVVNGFIVGVLNINQDHMSGYSDTALQVVGHKLNYLQMCPVPGPMQCDTMQVSDSLA